MASGSNVDSINGLDGGNSLHMNPHDSTSTFLIPFKLIGHEIYRIWAIAMKLALQARNKYAFVDGSCVKSAYDSSNVLSAQWDRCNVVVLTWIINYVSADVYMRLVYYVDATSIWKDLESTYDKGGIPQRNPEGIPESSSVIETKLNATSFATKSSNNFKRSNNNGNNNTSYTRSNNTENGNRGPNPNLSCKNCGMIAHTIKRCYELIGYHPGFKKVNNPIKQTCFKQNFNADSNVKTNDKQQYAGSQNSFSSFTPEHMKKLLSLINETSSGSVHANIAVVPGYCVSLFSIILGTGSESGGLYLFDLQSDKNIGNVNMIHAFNVSKSPWHSRLGHPADQVLAVLKDELKLSKNTDVYACEVCHRAKQTNEPFPLSDHKSKKVGDLIHLDLSDKYVLLGYSSSKKAYKLFSFDNKNVVFSKDVKFYKTVFPFKMRNINVNEKVDADYASDAYHLTFFDNQLTQSPFDEERATSVVEDSVQFEPRRSSRVSKLPAKLNDYVVDSKLKYGLEKHGSYVKLNIVNYCFETTLNKFVEPSSYYEAAKDSKWIEVMNKEIDALYKNYTWTIVDL
nr:hypothetical protein [Tanacetum cinerariifolium]